MLFEVTLTCPMSSLQQVEQEGGNLKEFFWKVFHHRHVQRLELAVAGESQRGRKQVPDDGSQPRLSSGKTPKPSLHLAFEEHEPRGREQDGRRNQEGARLEPVRLSPGPAVRHPLLARRRFDGRQQPGQLDRGGVQTAATLHERSQIQASLWSHTHL